MVTETIRTRMHVPRLLAAATIRGRRLFRSDSAATVISSLSDKYKHVGHSFLYAIMCLESGEVFFATG